MLDVSVQAQIIQLLMREREKRSLAVLFISHDLEVINAFCDTVIVMQKGEVVESGKCSEVFRNPKAEFTKYLLDSYIKI